VGSIPSPSQLKDIKSWYSQLPCLPSLLVVSLGKTIKGITPTFERFDW